MQKITFSGERMIPHLNKGMALYYEHINRYQFASQFVKGLRVLDLACGSGYGASILATKAKDVVGLDISPEAIVHARQTYRSDKIKFQIGDALQLPFDNNQFDVVVCFEFIEHTSAQVKALQEIKRVLKDSGLLLISTPNKETYPAKNKYHQKELAFTEFKKLLSNYYKYTKVMEQHFLLTSAIVHGKSQRKERGWPERAGLWQVENINRKDAQYFIAICSDQKQTLADPSFFITSKTDNIDFTKGAEVFDSKLAQKQLLAEQLKQELASIKATFWYKCWKKIKQLAT